MRSQIFVSALTGEGLPELKSAMKKILGVTDSSDAQIAVSARHKELLQRAESIIEHSTFNIQHSTFNIESPWDTNVVLLAQTLREAAEALAEITGRNVGEDILDKIFSTFCIGK